MFILSYMNRDVRQSMQNRMRNCEQLKAGMPAFFRFGLNLEISAVVERKQFSTSQKLHGKLDINEKLLS